MTGILDVLAALVRSARRHPSLVVNAVLLLAIVGATYWRFGNRAEQPTPADLFMQSVETEDGSLGWNQLCPALQVQLPRDVLEQHTDRLRSDHVQNGTTLTIEHIGDRPRAGGGEIRVYVATAHTADGSTGEKTYVLQTQASGCVESVQ
jgi:hypothetical protein